MAKFHNYYVLCPLIDQKSFLGVSEDREEQNVIVTLGRNVVNKYRLVDQKQVGGWTSRDHITSNIIYDKEQDCYVGIFNKNIIKIWKEDTDNLDKVKKHKFPVDLLKVVPRKDKSPIVVFSNGNCASLQYAIDNRKTYESKSFIKDTESIVDIASYTHNKQNYICYVVKNCQDTYEVINCPIREELGDLERSMINKIKVTRPEDVYVVGELITTTENVFAIYILWSDSKLTVYDLIDKSWKTIGTVPWISTFSSVSLTWIGENHLMIFGSNIDQDGAIIIAYNVLLGVGAGRYPMKMYTEGAKLYCFNNRIILESSNHIGMLQYLLETKRNISSLLGSHDIVEDECTEIATWDTPTEPLFDVVEEIKEHLKVGISERAICAQVIPPLLERNHFRKVLRVLQEFKDVPEPILVKLLDYVLKSLNSNDIDLTNHPEFLKYCSTHEPESEQFLLLNYIFQIGFSDALLIPYLRNGLTLNDALFLMSYITYLLVDSDVNINTEYESKLLDWCILLMDAFYQQYLMTKNEKVTHVLQTILNVVVNLVKQLNAVNNTMTTLNKFLSAKGSNANEESLSYSIELMQI